MRTKCLLLLVLASLTASVHGAGLQMSHMLNSKGVPTLNKKASFQENWSRYPSPDVILNKLYQDFPRVERAQNMECLTLKDTNRSVLGDSQPMTGRPAIDNPNSSFVNWYGSCVASLITSENYASMNLTGEDQYLAVNGPAALNACKAVYADKNAKEAADYAEWKSVYDQAVENAHRAEAKAKRHETKGKKGNKAASADTQVHIPMPVPPTVSPFNADYCMWADLSSAGKNALINFYLEKYIGPEDVIIDLGLAASEKELSDMLSNYLDGFNAAPDDKFNFLIYSTPTAGYLSTANAVTIVKLLVHLEDINKY